MKTLPSSEKIAVFIITLFPIFGLLVKGWVSAILFLSVLISVIYFFKKSKLKLKTLREEITRSRLNYLLIVIPFSLPIGIVLISSLAKGHLEWRDFDGPSRYLLSLLVFFFLVSIKQSLEEWISYTVPLMPILTILIIDFTEKKHWALSSRLSVYFIDPLIFGSLSLAFGLISMVFLSYQYRFSWKSIFYLISMLSGFYLSYASESRTGWFAIPIALFILIKYKYKFNFIKTFIITSLIAMLIALGTYHFSDVIKKRTNEMFDDIKAYQWNDVNENTSVGERISYIRMGWYYMTLRPMTGWKNLDFLVHKDDSQITKYSSPEIRVGVKGGGFHNEYITNAVHYGIPGLLYTLFLFIGPGLFFIFHLKVEPTSKVGLAGLVLIVTQSISSLSYQVLDFKFTASLYAMMIIALAAAAMHEKKRSYFKLGEH